MNFWGNQELPQAGWRLLGHRFSTWGGTSREVLVPNQRWANYVGRSLHQGVPTKTGKHTPNPRPVPSGIPHFVVALGATVMDPASPSPAWRE